MNAKAKILVVDDDADTQHLLGDFLSKQGYIVSTAFSAESALRLVSPEAPPDLVISDVQMAPMDGFGLANRLLARHQNLPIILISAIGGKDKEREALSHGARRFLAKPFPLGAIAAAVREELNRQIV
jgi:DNA-binding response OmpR family regulator